MTPEATPLKIDPEIVSMALDLADEAATSAIETHGRRTDKEGRWYDIAGEPVEQDALYLEKRGLLTREPWSLGSLVCLLD
jgi:hypothetical protein